MEIQSKGVRSAIVALYMMNFLTSSGFGVFGVIVPLYMRDLGVSFVGLGLAFSVFGIVMGAAGMIFGAHSDIVGRKPYLVLSLALSAVVDFFYTQARSVVDLVILQALSGVSASLNSMIVPALMTDLTKESERGRKFGRMGGFGWLGVGVGYFLGGALSHFFGYASSFIFVSMLSLISSLIILGFVPSYRLPSGERFNITFIRGISPNLKMWLLISFVTALVIGPVEVMVIPSYAVEPGPLGIDKIVFGTFMSVSYILVSSMQFIGGNLADKYSRRKLASLFFLVSAPFVAVQPLFPYFLYFALMYVLEGVGEGLNHPCTNAIVASSVRSKHRGFDFSILNLIGNIGGTIGFLGIGFILDTAGFVYPFVIRAMTYIVAAILIYFKLTD
jgi:DHA1 family tetracycline resistance protein-like MFS transporter